MENNRGQVGLVSGLVFGIAGLVIGVIIAFVIVSTLVNSDIIGADSTETLTVTNETLTATDGIGTTTAGVLNFFTSWNATLIINQTRGPGTLTNETLVEGTDYQIFASNGSIGNITEWNSSFCTYDWVRTTETTKNSVGNMSSNLTEGVNEISEKIPTVLLIAAIVLILSVLAILVGVWQKMRMGGSSI